MKLLGPRAVAAKLGVSKSKLYAMLKQGQFPQAPIRLPGGSPRWPERMVDEWVETHRGWGRRQPGEPAAAGVIRAPGFTFCRRIY